MFCDGKMTVTASLPARVRMPRSVRVEQMGLGEAARDGGFGETGLLFVPQQVAHPHDRVDLLLCEAGEEMAPDRFRVDGASRFESLASGRGEHHQNLPLARTTLDQGSLLHAGQVVGEAALVPAQAFGEFLLAHRAPAGEPR